MVTKHPSSAHLTNSPEPRMPWTDEVLEELYAHRAEYAARFEHDLRRIYEDLKAKEASNPLHRTDLRPRDAKPGKVE